MYLPDINLKKTSAWYKGSSDPPDLSLDDSQVCTQGMGSRGRMCCGGFGRDMRMLDAPG